MTVERASDLNDVPARQPRAIVVGASAGALDALSTILSVFPPSFSFPIIVVVHLPADRESLIANILQQKCQLTVRKAEDKETVVGGCVYLAPPNYHLLLESDHSLSLSCDEALNFSRPSIDVLFESAADAYEDGLIGVILTGANNDGAQGLKKIQESGGIALVQRPEEAYSSAMPLAAMQACPGARILSLIEIAEFLLEQADPV